jgi:hypothetical protein
MDLINGVKKVVGLDYALIIVSDPKVVMIHEDSNYRYMPPKCHNMFDKKADR